MRTLPHDRKRDPADLQWLSLRQLTVAAVAARSQNESVAELGRQLGRISAAIDGRRAER